MASTAASARLQHLQDASWALMASSPTVAAHLQSARMALMEESGGSTSIAEDGRVCKACGSILIPGWSCETSSKKAKRRKHCSREDKKMSTPIAVGSFQLRCTRCHATNTLQSRKAPKAKTRTPSMSDAKPGQDLGLLPAPVITTPAAKPSASKTNEVSTKVTGRKARGKKSSLHSLLASQKHPDPTPATKSGLDLMDFMKT